MNLKLWIREKNREGKWLRIGELLSFSLNVFRYHSLTRFRNRILVWWKTKSGAWELVSAPKNGFNRMFYSCIYDTPSARLVNKIPRGDNSYSHNFLQRIRNQEEWAAYRRAIEGILSDKFVGKHVAPLVKVRRDGGYESCFIDGPNLSELRQRLFYAKGDFEKSDFSGLIRALKALLQSIEKYHEQNGMLIGDWALHNLIFDKKKELIINVDLEGFYTYRSGDADIESNFEYFQRLISDIVLFLEINSEDNLRKKKVSGVVSIIDEVRRSETAYNGQQFLIGYHSLELDGYSFRGQRDCVRRLMQVPFDFTNKVVADFGCNSGGMLHAISEGIEFGYGFDFNQKCINAANLISDINNTSNLSFFQFDLDHDELSLVPHFFVRKSPDIVLFLSVAMWLRRWEEVLRYLSSLSDAMLFESNGESAQQEKQIKVLADIFTSVELIDDSSEDDPLQSSRRLFLCKGSRLHAS